MSVNKLVKCRFIDRQQGFTLLEVLIAIVVLSFGLLGLAALQLKALQDSHSSYQFSIANLAAKDIREKLWAALLVDAVYIEQGRVTCPSDKIKDARLSNVVSRAKEAWTSEGDVEEKLPAMTVSISYVPECEYEVTIGWRDDRNGLEEEGVDGLITNLNYYVRLPGYPFDPDLAGEDGG
jgi:type IV pilus assembly protein PilV